MCGGLPCGKKLALPCLFTLSSFFDQSEKKKCFLVFSVGFHLFMKNKKVGLCLIVFGTSKIPSSFSLTFYGQEKVVGNIIFVVH